MISGTSHPLTVLALYVDWLGRSVYGPQYKEEAWSDIPSLVDWPYKEMSGLDPNKPIMIAEWGAGEFPRGNKAEWIKVGDLSYSAPSIRESRRLFTGTNAGKTRKVTTATCGSTLR